MNSSTSSAMKSDSEVSNSRGDPRGACGGAACMSAAGALLAVSTITGRSFVASCVLSGTAPFCKGSPREARSITLRLPSGVAICRRFGAVAVFTSDCAELPENADLHSVELSLQSHAHLVAHSEGNRLRSAALETSMRWPWKRRGRKRSVAGLPPSKGSQAAMRCARSCTSTTEAKASSLPAQTANADAMASE